MNSTRAQASQYRSPLNYTEPCLKDTIGLKKEQRWYVPIFLTCACARRVETSLPNSIACTRFGEEARKKTNAIWRYRLRKMKCTVKLLNGGHAKFATTCKYTQS